MRFNAATRCRRLVSLAVAGGFIGAGSGAGASDREGAGAGAGAGTGAEDDVLDAGMATAAHSSAEEALARFSTGEGPQSKLIWEVRARLSLVRRPLPHGDHAWGGSLVICRSHKK